MSVNTYSTCANPEGRRRHCCTQAKTHVAAVVHVERLERGFAKPGFAKTECQSLFGPEYECEVDCFFEAVCRFLTDLLSGCLFGDDYVPGPGCLFEAGCLSGVGYLSGVDCLFETGAGWIGCLSSGAGFFGDGSRHFEAVSAPALLEKADDLEVMT